MKIKTITFLIGFLLLLQFQTTGMEMRTGFAVEEVREDIQAQFIDNVDLTIQNQQDTLDVISCFDINEKGWIALGHNHSTKCTIDIYSDKMDYLYSYSFNSSGSYGIEWDKDNLIIHFVRSDIALLVDSDGNCLDIKKINNTAQNNEYWNHVVFAKEKRKDDTIYKIENRYGLFNLFAMNSYSILSKTDSEHHTIDLYDVSELQKRKIIFIGCIFLLCFLVVLFVAIRVVLSIKKALNGTTAINVHIEP